MSSIVLTDQELVLIWSRSESQEDFGRRVEQAVLQSEQVQAWKRDAERYRHMRNVASPSDWDYIGNQDPEVIDVEIDAAMEKQK